LKITNRIVLAQQMGTVIFVTPSGKLPL